MFNPNFDLSLVYPQAFPSANENEILENFERLADLDVFDVIEITTITHAQLRKEAEGLLRHTFKAVFFLAGLPSFQAKAFLNAEGEDRLRAVEYTKRLIEEAAAIGASAILVVSGPDVPSVHRLASQSRLTNSLVELCEFANRNFPGIQIRLEHADREIHRRQLIGPSSNALEVIGDVAKAGFTLDLNLDLSHILQLGENVRETLDIAKQFCRHVHLSNCILSDPTHPLFGDQHPPFGYPGSEVDLAELAKTIQYLKGLGYLGTNNVTTLGVEVVPLRGEDPWENLERAVLAVESATNDALGGS